MCTRTLIDSGCGVCFTRLADVYGRKIMVLSAFFFFACFSLGCGLAQSVEQLIIFRTFQGIGGAGLYSLTMVICPEISPSRFLHIVVGSLGATVAIAGVCGPVLGGVITGNTTWRWIFWLKYAAASPSNVPTLTCRQCSNWCGRYDRIVYCLANKRKHHTDDGSFYYQATRLLGSSPHGCRKCMLRLYPAGSWI